MSSDNERVRLAPMVGRRARFMARVDGYGVRYSQERMVPTVCLQDIRIPGEDGVAADHVWVDKGSILDRLMVSRGDEIEFLADVIQYSRGGPRYYRNRQGKQVANRPYEGDDYGLSRLGCVKIISRSMK